MPRKPKAANKSFRTLTPLMSSTFSDESRNKQILPAIPSSGNVPRMRALMGKMVWPTRMKEVTINQ